jgi:hypothetical protein
MSNSTSQSTKGHREESSKSSSERLHNHLGSNAVSSVKSTDVSENRITSMFKPDK